MNTENIINIISEHIYEVIPELEGHQFDSKDTLKRLGANSVDRSEIIMMTLESLSLNIPLVDLAYAQNIGDLANILYEKLHRK